MDLMDQDPNAELQTNEHDMVSPNSSTTSLELIPLLDHRGRKYHLPPMLPKYRKLADYWSVSHQYVP